MTTTTTATTAAKAPVPPFTDESATLKARLAENAWNTCDPHAVSLGYSVDSRWRNRAEIFSGRDKIVEFLTRKWEREHEYRLIKELWAQEQRVTDLMQAARALAARDGVRTVTLTAIATQAGVHVSAVRRYFESREEILLGLAEQGYAEWAQALTDRIHGRDGLTSTDLAQAVTATLVEGPLFCDLLTHVTLNLEREVTYERVHTFKFTVSAILGPLQEVITGATLLTPEQTGDLVIATIALTAPLWQAAHPAETLTRLYAEEPTLAHIGIDFAPTLTRLLTALCDGMTTAHK